MKTDSTGIAARMMLSLDRERICVTGSFKPSGLFPPALQK